MRYLDVVSEESHSKLIKYLLKVKNVLIIPKLNIPRQFSKISM
jgi:hypothetical protein